LNHYNNDDKENNQKNSIKRIKSLLNTSSNNKEDLVEALKVDRSNSITKSSQLNENVSLFTNNFLLNHANNNNNNSASNLITSSSTPLLVSSHSIILNKNENENSRKVSNSSATGSTSSSTIILQNNNLKQKTAPSPQPTQQQTKKSFEVNSSKNPERQIHLKRAQHINTPESSSSSSSLSDLRR
jgi:hypothetical protein